MDDALSLLFLFAQLPNVRMKHVRHISVCRWFCLKMSLNCPTHTHTLTLSLFLSLSLSLSRSLSLSLSHTHTHTHTHTHARAHSTCDPVARGACTLPPPVYRVYALRHRVPLAAPRFPLHQGTNVPMYLCAIYFGASRQETSHLSRFASLPPDRWQGIYYQAEIMGQTLTWITPYQFCANVRLHLLLVCVFGCIYIYTYIYVCMYVFVCVCVCVCVCLF
jgi:hypothetical protein